MTLYLIGIGLYNEKDISQRGLETVKKADKIYLENYTSTLQCSKKDLEEYYGRKVKPANREFIEQNNQILKEAKEKDIALLIIGDPITATTHIHLYLDCKEKGINVEIINNASILSAVGITGLQTYKFGRTASIPYAEDYKKIKTPYNILKQNLENDLHSLFLLDLEPEKEKFMTIKESIEILETIEKEQQENIINDDTTVIGVSRLGTPDPEVKTGELKKIKNEEFGEPPYSLIIPAENLHFKEKEAIDMFRI